MATCFLCDKEQKLSTSPCQHPSPTPIYFMFVVVQLYEHCAIKLIVENLILWQMCTIPPPNVVFMLSVNVYVRWLDKFHH
jgi:hypothetical protein